MAKIPNDAYHETVRVEKPDCHLWIDVVDENGDLLMRVGVHPNDSYHKKHGRVSLAYQSRARWPVPKFSYI